MSEKHLLELDHISKYYGNINALRDEMREVLEGNIRKGIEFANAEE